MKTIFLIVIVILVTTSIYAQTQNEIRATKVVYDKPVKGGAIRYYFPRIVDSIISTVVIKSSCKSFFIEYELINDTTIISVHTNCEGNTSIKIDTLDDVGLLLSSTNRYFKIESTVMPIYFWSDIKCAFPKVVYTGGALYLKFLGKYPDQGSILEIEK